MNRVVILVGIVSVVGVSGCGGSIEREYYESAGSSSERTRIHVLSNEERPDYRVVEAQPVHLHIHSANGQSVCVEITTGRD